jgi:hypothetical protein
MEVNGGNIVDNGIHGEWSPGMDVVSLTVSDSCKL